jgi:serine beta-lactamase-like protein LACTB
VYFLLSIYLLELDPSRGEFQNSEYFIKDHYDSVLDSLTLFSKDDLLHAPGTQFHYTTHGWTLLSAVIERVSGQPFLDLLHSNVLSPLGMDSTGPEQHDSLTYHRARYYFRNSSGRLLNSPYVDISYKWAGGGLVSSAPDLCRLGSSLLLCSQSKPNSSSPSIRKSVEQWKSTGGDSTSESCAKESPLLLKPETVSAMWREVVRNIYFSSNPRLSYGLGWIVRKEGERVQGGKWEPFCVGHTGAAVGASSVLLILPDKTEEKEVEGNLSSEALALGDERCDIVAVGGSDVRCPSGVVVAIMFNLQHVQGMFSLGSKIATLFCRLAATPPVTHKADVFLA